MIAVHHTRFASRKSCGGFTLAELTIATLVGTVVMGVVIVVMARSTHLVRSNATQVLAHARGAKVLRKIYSDLQQASDVKVWANYSAYKADTNKTKAQLYGSYITFKGVDGITRAYYRFPDPDRTGAAADYWKKPSANAGVIYYDASVADGSDYTKDKALLSSVQDLEFREDANEKAVRIGFAVGTLGFPSVNIGSKETDLIRLSTSVNPRNIAK